MIKFGKVQQKFCLKNNFAYLHNLEDRKHLKNDVVKKKITKKDQHNNYVPKCPFRTPFPSPFRLDKHKHTPNATLAISWFGFHVNQPNLAARARTHTAVCVKPYPSSKGVAGLGGRYLEESVGGNAAFCSLSLSKAS